MRAEQERVRLNSPAASSRENRSYLASAREMLPAAQRFATTTVVYRTATVVLQIRPTEINLTIARGKNKANPKRRMKVMRNRLKATLLQKLLRQDRKFHSQRKMLSFPCHWCLSICLEINSPLLLSMTMFLNCSQGTVASATFSISENLT